MALLHEHIFEVEDPDSVDVMFDESDGPTQRLTRDSSVPARESVVVPRKPRDPLATLVQADIEAETPDALRWDDHGVAPDRHAVMPEPPQPEPMLPASSRPTIVPALRVAVYIAKDGTPQLALHDEGDVVGAPTALLVPDGRDDALRILQIFERARAQ